MRALGCQGALLSRVLPSVGWQGGAPRRRSRNLCSNCAVLVLTCLLNSKFSLCTQSCFGIHSMGFSWLNAFLDGGDCAGFHSAFSGNVPANPPSQTSSICICRHPSFLGDVFVTAIVYLRPWHSSSNVQLEPIFLNSPPLPLALACPAFQMEVWSLLIALVWWPGNRREMTDVMCSLCLAESESLSFSTYVEAGTVPMEGGPGFKRPPRSL